MQNYNSLDGFSTHLWGSCLWHVLRTISFNYPPNPSPEQKYQYKKFILYLGHVLPCVACRENYYGNLKSCGFETVDVFHNRDTFSRFIYNLETTVNKMVSGYPTLRESFEQRRSIYQRFRAKCIKQPGGENGCTAQKTRLRALIRIVPWSKKRVSFKIY